MLEIQDEQLIQTYIHQYNLEDHFLQIPSMKLFQFEKQEVLNTKLNPNQFFLIFVKGKLHLTNVRKDGSSYQILNITALTCLGDIELLQPVHKQYIITSDTQSHLLVIDLPQYRETLLKDYKFLQYVLHNVIQKLNMSSSIYADNDSLADRLLQHAQNNDGTITEIEKTANQLCCSRRHLQRIIQNLCQEGKLQKIQKGKYKRTDMKKRSG